MRHLWLLLDPWDLRYLRYNIRQLGTGRDDGERATTWHDWESRGKQGHDREVEEVLVAQNLCRDDSSQVLVGAIRAESESILVLCSSQLRQFSHCTIDPVLNAEILHIHGEAKIEGIQKGEFLRCQL